ncbi:sulfatase-like hydrolase/transferase [Photobacterium sp. DNB22_13_2]
MTIPSFKKCLLASSLISTFGVMHPAVASTASSVADGIKGQPNVVIIVADDLGHADAGFYQGEWNSEDTISNQTTKYIRKIASNGAVFNHGYVTAPVCGPSRAGMLTGRYQQSFGFYSNPAPDDPDDNDPMDHAEGVEPGIPTEIPTIGNYFQNAGYTTAFIGKDHDGEDWKFWPHNRGFDYFFGFNNGAVAYEIGDKNQFNTFTTPHSTMWQTFDAGHQAPTDEEIAAADQLVSEHFQLLGELACESPNENDPDVCDKERTEKQLIAAFDKNKAENDSTYDPSTYRTEYYSALETVAGLHIEPDFEGVYLTDKFGEKAVDFISSQANGQQPFLLYLAFNAVHTPLKATDVDESEINYVGPEYISDEDKSSRKTALAMAKSLDNSVSKIYKKLKRKGILENTIIVFVSDNGGKPKSNFSSNKPLSGHKGELYEGGTRVPFAISWPGKIEPQVIDEPVITLDILPTILDAAGVDMSDKEAYDLHGVNLLPRLTSQSAKLEDRYLFWDRVNKAAVFDGEFKLLKTRKKQYQLFRLRDCGKDACESDSPVNFAEFEEYLDSEGNPQKDFYDVSDVNPEKLEELKNALAAFQCENPVPTWGVKAPDPSIYNNPEACPE